MSICRCVWRAASFLSSFFISRADDVRDGERGQVVTTAIASERASVFPEIANAHGVTYNSIYLSVEFLLGFYYVYEHPGCCHDARQPLPGRIRLHGDFRSDSIRT